MKPNIFYIVTKGSKNGTFLKDDRIKLIENNVVVCDRAKGFLSEEEFKKYKKEIKIIIDKSYIKNIINRHKNKIKKLKKEVDL